MEQVTWKKIGANMSVMLDGERLAKKVTMEEGELVKIAVKAMNNSIEKGHKESTIDKYRKKILAVMRKATIEKKKKEETEKATSKAKYRHAKKTSKKNKSEDSVLLKELKNRSKDSLTEEEIARLRELLDEHGKVNKKPSVTSSKSGTVYRENYQNR